MRISRKKTRGKSPALRLRLEILQTENAAFHAMPVNGPEIRVFGLALFTCDRSALGFRAKFKHGMNLQSVKTANFHHPPRRKRLGGFDRVVVSHWFFLS